MKPPPAAPAPAPPPSPTFASARRELAGGARGEFLHGFGASSVSILLTFPLAKLASRQTYEGLKPLEAARTLRADGIAHLYRGVLPPLLQKGPCARGAGSWRRARALACRRARRTARVGAPPFRAPIRATSRVRRRVHGRVLRRV
jgi:hypothetical protein